MPSETPANSSSSPSSVNLLDPELTAEAFKAKLLAAMPAEKKEGKKRVDALKKVNDSKSLWLNAFYGENGKHMCC